MRKRRVGLIYSEELGSRHCVKEMDREKEEDKNNVQ